MANISKAHLDKWIREIEDIGRTAIDIPKAIQNERDIICKRYPRLIAEVLRLRGSNVELLKALQFYATAWDTHPGDSGPGGNDPQDPVCDPDEDLLEDGGQKALAAIAKATSGDA